MGKQNPSQVPQTPAPPSGPYRLPGAPGDEGYSFGQDPAAGGQISPAVYIAGQLYNAGTGQHAYPGATYVPMSGTSADALAQIEAIAGGGNPALAEALASARRIIAGNGFSPELSGALDPLRQVAGGGASVGTRGAYDALHGAAGMPSAAAANLGGIASGATGIGTGGFYADLYAAAGQSTAAQDYLTATARGDYLEQPNPYLQQILADRSATIANQVKAAYSGMGRYGSSTMNRDLTDRLAQFQAGVLSENYDTERARQLQATQMIDAARQSQLSARYQAATGLTSTEAANLANRMDAARAMDAAAQDRFSAQLAALGGATNAAQADIGNRMGAASTLADAYAAALNRTVNAYGAVPGLDAARYDAAMRLAQVGAAREANAAAQLADQVARYNYEQRAPWDALAWYQAIAAGHGSFGSTVEPVPVTASPWLGAFGR